jgi:hypothetical protein
MHGMVTYAVYAVSGIALVCVLAQAVLALCDAQGGGGDDLVEGVWAAREDFARVAMANNRNLSVFAIQQVFIRGERWIGYVPENVALLLTVELGCPFRVAAVALSVV